jgi:hypothetical protein
MQRADIGVHGSAEPIVLPEGRESTIAYLLDQKTWWKPRQGPPVLIADMTDTHRLHTAAWLFKRAEMLADAEATSMVFGPFQPSGDMACDAFDDIVGELLDRPLEWLRGKPLFGALLDGLPTPAQPDAWSDLLARAKHWSTCARNRVLAAPVCTCTPRDDIVEGATRFALPGGPA